MRRMQPAVSPSTKLKEIADLHLSDQLNALQTRRAMEKLHPSLNGTDDAFAKLKLPEDYPEAEFLLQQLDAALNRFVEGLEMALEWVDTNIPETLEQGLEICQEADATLAEILRESNIEVSRLPGFSFA